MDDLLICDVEEELVQKLERRAQMNGRSLEEETREILRQALLDEEEWIAASHSEA